MARLSRPKCDRAVLLGCESVDSCQNLPRQPSPKECIQHGKVSTATDSRSADNFYFIFIPPIHYTTYFYLLTGQSHPSRGGRKAKTFEGPRSRAGGQLRNDSCQLPRRRGRADVSDPVVRHPPERGTNPLPRTKDPTARMDLPGA